VHRLKVALATIDEAAERRLLQIAEAAAAAVSAKYPDAIPPEIANQFVEWTIHQHKNYACQSNS
jgi:hypothetical protein